MTPGVSGMCSQKTLRAIRASMPTHPIVVRPACEWPSVLSPHHADSVSRSRFERHDHLGTAPGRDAQHGGSSNPAPRRPRHLSRTPGAHVAADMGDAELKLPAAVPVRKCSFCGGAALTADEGFGGL